MVWITVVKHLYLGVFDAERRDFAHQRSSGEVWGRRSLPHDSAQSAIGIWRVEAEDSVPHPTTHRTTPHSKELSSLRCRESRG